MAFTYLVHGLAVQMPFSCEELGDAVPSRAADLRVLAGAVPRQLAQPDLRDGPIDMLPSTFLYRGGIRSARFLAQDGRAITYEKNPQCEQSLFFHHLLYPVMAAALWQRGMFVLHASSVLSPDGAVLVAGASGAGKSTTVAHLVREGWPLLTDDVTAMTLSSAGVLHVMPGARHVHIGQAAASHLELDTAGLVRHSWHRMKMAVPVPVAAARPSAQVARIAVLGLAESFTVRRVRGRAKVPLLLRSIYGPLLRRHAVSHQALLARALADFDMIAIGRPPGAWTLTDVTKAIVGG